MKGRILAVALLLGGWLSSSAYAITIERDCYYYRVRVQVGGVCWISTCYQCDLYIDGVFIDSTTDCIEVPCTL